MSRKATSGRIRRAASIAATASDTNSASWPSVLRSITKVSAVSTRSSTTRHFLRTGGGDAALRVRSLLFPGHVPWPVLGCRYEEREHSDVVAATSADRASAEGG